MLVLLEAGPNTLPVSKTQKNHNMTKIVPHHVKYHAHVTREERIRRKTSILINGKEYHEEKTTEDISVCPDYNQGNKKGLSPNRLKNISTFIYISSLSWVFIIYIYGYHCYYEVSGVLKMYNPIFLHVLLAVKMAYQHYIQTLYHIQSYSVNAITIDIISVSFWS